MKKRQYHIMKNEKLQSASNPGGGGGGWTRLRNGLWTVPPALSKPDPVAIIMGLWCHYYQFTSCFNVF